MIYFIRPVDGGPIKIGTSIDVMRRLKELQWTFRIKMHVLGIIDGNEDIEHSLHIRFGHIRIGGSEWFHPTNELIAFIDRETQRPDKQFATMPDYYTYDGEYLNWLEERLCSHRFSGIGGRLEYWIRQNKLEQKV